MSTLKYEVVVGGEPIVEHRRTLYWMPYIDAATDLPIDPATGYSPWIQVKGLGEKATECLQSSLNGYARHYAKDWHFRSTRVKDNDAETEGNTFTLWIRRIGGLRKKISYRRRAKKTTAAVQPVETPLAGGGILGAYS